MTAKPKIIPLMLSEAGPVERQLLTVKEVATILGVSTDFVYDLIAAKQLPAAKMNSIYRVRRSTLDK